MIALRGDTFNGVTQLRPYADSDATACCNVINAALAGMDGMNAAARTKVIAKNIPAVLGAELRAAYTLVSEDAGQVCGVGCLAGDEIKRLDAQPSAQRRGTGRALVTALEQEARRRGLRRSGLRHRHRRSASTSVSAT